MASYNNVTQRGRLGHDPVICKTANGKSVLDINIAVYAGKDKTDWFKWVLWEKNADEFYLRAHKGDMVRLFGRAATTTGKTKSGEEVKQVVFVCDDYEITPKLPKVVVHPTPDEYAANNSAYYNEDVPF